MFLIAFLIMLLMGCVTEDTYAPVVNGWSDPAAMKSRYRVQEGDTIYSIACAFEMDYRDLARANHLSAPYSLRTGETLSMHVPVELAQETIQPTTQLIEKNLPTPVAKLKPEEKKSPVLAEQHIILPEVELKPISMTLDKPNKPDLVSLKEPDQKTCPWPANGKIIHGFNLQTQGGNKGVDIAGSEGSAVKAVAAGQVVYCGSSLPGYGNLIILKHDESYLTLYGHNKKMLVKEGDVVKKGAQIAEMGHTNAGVSMVHFEVRKNGKPVNPLNFMQHV